MKTTYKKNGFIFKQVSRMGDVAIYSQHASENGPALFFEVFLVQKNPERTIGGIRIASSESCPGNEQWGVLGYTVKHLAEAETKAIILHRKGDRRKNGTTYTLLNDCSNTGPQKSEKTGSV